MPKDLDLAETAGIALYPMIRAWVAQYLGAWGPVADFIVMFAADWFAKERGGDVAKFLDGVKKGALATLLYSVARGFMPMVLGGARAAAAATFGGYGRRMYAPVLRWRGRRIII